MRKDKSKPFSLTKTICDYLIQNCENENQIKDILFCFFKSYTGDKHPADLLNEHEKTIYKLIANVKNQRSITNKINGSKGGGQYGNQNARTHPQDSKQWQYDKNNPDSLTTCTNEIIFELERQLKIYANNQKKNNQDYTKDFHSKKRIYKDNQLYYQFKSTDYHDIKNNIKDKLLKGDIIRTQYIQATIANLPTLAKIRKTIKDKTYQDTIHTDNPYEYMQYLNECKTNKDFMKNGKGQFYTHRLFTNN